MKHRLFDWIVYVNQHDKGVQCYSVNHVQLFATPWAIACQAPLSTGFSRQEYWSGLPFLSLGDLPDQELNPGLLHCRQILYHLSHSDLNNIETGGGNRVPLFLLFIYFNWRLITLQYRGGFCHTFTWISPGCTCVPFPEPPSYLPPHPIPKGHPSAPALSTLSHASNLDWWSISHMIIYMFQCYSFKSSHPCLLPQSPKVCSLHLCLFCCLAHRVIITIILNSIYMH